MKPEEEEKKLQGDFNKNKVFNLEGDISKEPEDVEEPREQWSQKFDFLMSIIGFSVDLAGIWRL